MRRRLLLMLLLATGLAFGQGSQFVTVASNSNGSPVKNPVVRVCGHPAVGQPCTNTATIYTDQTLGTTAANPATGDNYGNVTLYAPSGYYDLQYYLATGKFLSQQTVLFPAPSGGGGGGSGTVTSVSSGNFSPLFNVSITNPTITPAFSFSAINQTANQVYAGPASGVAAAPGFRALVSADIPANAANTTGNASTATALASAPSQCGANNFATGVAASGNANCAQPAASNLSNGTTGSGAAVLAGSATQTDVTLNQNANGDDAILSLRKTDTSPTGNFLHFKNAANNADLWRVDITGTLQAGAVPTSLLSGTIGNGQLASSYSGVGSCAASNWVHAVNANAAPTCTQPAYSDLTGTPTLEYQTVKANGTAQTQRPTINLISGANATVSCADNSGSDQTDCTVAASASSGMTNPMTTLGDVIYENSTPAPARLAGQTTTTKEYLSQTGAGSVSAAPAWAQINFADIAGTVANSQLHDSYSGVGACAAHNWASTLNGDAAPSCTQPGFGDVSGSATNAQLPASTAHQILTGANPGYQNEANAQLQNASTPSAITQGYTNDGSTGTGTGLIAKLNGNDQAVKVGTSDTEALGICVSGCSTSGTGQIAVSGSASCTFDNTSTAGHYVQISTGTAGDCHDAGATLPTSGGTIVGRVADGGAAGAHNVAIALTPPGSAGGGSSSRILGGSFSASQQVGASSTSNAFPDGYLQAAASSEASRQMASPVTCTVGNLYVTIGSAQSGTGSIAFNFRKNAANCGPSVTIAAGAAAGTYSDTTNTCAVTAGDLMSIQIVNSATASGAVMNGLLYTCN